MITNSGRARKRPESGLSVAAIASVCMLSACAPPSETTNEPFAPLPATFVGVLPCADCPGIEYHLDLLPRSAASLKRSYLDRDFALDATGSWSLAEATGQLAVWGAGREPILFSVIDTDTLRLLDRNGQAIESRLNYDLTRAPEFDPATLSGALRGMYRFSDGAGVFSECESGREFAVAQTGDEAALREAHAAAVDPPRESLLVSFDGELTMRSLPDGSGMQPTVTVNAFTGAWPRETCGARMSVSSLLDMNWVLIRLADDPVVLGENMREPRMVLRAAGNQVTGFTGCNNFTGGYAISGNSIEFGPLAANLRACAADESYESRLFDALENATRYTLSRHHFELYDAEDRLLARFEGRALD